MEELICSSFPRSGNHFTSQCLFEAFPNSAIRFDHKIYMLKESNNVISIVRRPEECVASFRDALPAYYTGVQVSGEARFGVDDNVLYYVRFMSAVKDNFNRIYVDMFDNLISDPNAVIQKYALKFNLSNALFVDKELALAMVDDSFTPARLNRFPEQYYDEIRGSKYYEDAMSLYEDIKRLVLSS